MGKRGVPVSSRPARRGLSKIFAAARSGETLVFSHLRPAHLSKWKGKVGSTKSVKRSVPGKTG